MSRSSEPFAFSFKPLNKSQRLAVRAFSSSDVCFFLGSSGSGKSFISLALALNEVKEGRKKKVVYCRPAVEVGRSIGFIPGSAEEKLAPYHAVAQRLVKKMVFRLPPEIIEFQPLSFVRGETFEDCTAILDEAQNCSYSELKTFLTRLGKGSKLIITGDSDQSDIRATQSEFVTDLDAIVDRLDDLEGVSVLDFPPSDVVRHPLVAKFVKLL